ncbi:hypothetical protein SEUCBS139899_006869 [Sporothrix eucalyptigena]|uniref:Antigenic cell wall galactomannoprotein n=1 Tax=Sporothrix eucalyptigena TaxID=1812306 RepID=A0ABP0BII1_9PEZI
MYVSSLIRAAAVAALATTAAADGAAIVDALNNVDSETQQLEQTVQGWNGGYLGSIPIVTQSLHVLYAINDGTDTANDSDELTTDEALSIATAVSTLATTVNGTMSAIIDAHDEFEHLLLAPIVLLDLKKQKSASDEMSAAIIAKVPTALQAIAQNLVAPIDASFTQAIEVYSLSNGI